MDTVSKLLFPPKPTQSENKEEIQHTYLIVLFEKIPVL